MGAVMILQRREDWPERLNEMIEMRRSMPFAWGLQDCASFAAACVLAMTDTPPLEGLPVWTSREQAETLLTELGGLEAAVTDRLGEPIDAAMARRGDVVLVDVAGVAALGVCLGTVAAAPGPHGLEWAPPAMWQHAWRIG